MKLHHIISGGENEVLVCESGLQVVVSGGHVEDDFENRKRLARLIQSAPYMLILLKEIYDWTNHKNTDWAKNAKTAIDMAELALKEYSPSPSF